MGTPGILHQFSQYRGVVCETKAQAVDPIGWIHFHRDFIFC